MKYAACKKCAKSVGIVNIFGNIMMIMIKGYLGVVGQSKGMIADAIHSCADLLATILMIIGMKVSDKEEDEDYPYGYGKAEYIVAIIIYLFLFAIATYIIINAVLSIITGYHHRPCMVAVWGAIFSIAINELMFRQSICAGTQMNSPSMVAKAWESRTDVYSSIAVLIGILGAKMGFYFMDPLAAIAVGVIILRICIEMIRESTLKLMDIAPEEDVIKLVKKALSGLKNISGVKDICAREIGRVMEFEVGLFVPAKTSLSQGEMIKNDAKQAVAGLFDNKTNVSVLLFAK
jgi:cation diffusion facilitator family transporter